MANACTCSHHCIPYYKNPHGKCRKGTNKVDTTGHLHKSKNGAYSMSAWKIRRDLVKFCDRCLFQSSLSPPKTAVGTVFCSSSTSVKAKSRRQLTQLCSWIKHIHECLNKHQMFLFYCWDWTCCVCHSPSGPWSSSSSSSSSMSISSGLACFESSANSLRDVSLLNRYRDLTFYFHIFESSLSSQIE